MLLVAAPARKTLARISQIETKSGCFSRRVEPAKQGV
jgi:hypothetical protein